MIFGRFFLNGAHLLPISTLEAADMFGRFHTSLLDLGRALLGLFFALPAGRVLQINPTRLAPSSKLGAIICPSAIVWVEGGLISGT